MNNTIRNRAAMIRAVIGLRWVLLICLTLSSLPSRAFQSKSDRAVNIPQKSLGIQVPIGIGGSLWRNRIPRNNPLLPSKVALGRALYFDKRLSVDGTPAALGFASGVHRRH